MVDIQWQANTDVKSGGSKQKGIITYGLAANRQNPFAGAFNDAIFNTFRRTRGTIFYWLPPLLAAYYLMDWANERYELPPHTALPICAED